MAIAAGSFGLARVDAANPPRPSVSQQNRQDEACGDCREHVVAAGLHPVVAGRRAVQAVAAPVVNDVEVAAVGRWQTATTVDVVPRPGIAVPVPGPSGVARVPALAMARIAAPIVTPIGPAVVTPFLRPITSTVGVTLFGL